MTYSIFHSTRALQVFLEAFVLLAVLAGLLRPGLCLRLLRPLDGPILRLSQRPAAAIAAAALLPLLLRLLLLPVFPIPAPRVHDEFSHLLLGDTLAHGRLSNPAPPSWQHFETEYVLVRPAYASQYQPGQGMILAIGEVLAGNAWWGVWLSVGLMFAALCWSLGFILPKRWALFGSLLAALQFGVFGFWMNSYYGGAVAAIGGALTFASLVRAPGLSSSALGGTGILLVLATRPAEGLIWLGVATVMMLRRHTPKRQFALFTLVLAAGASGLCYYNARITGHPLLPPYASYRGEYGTPQSYWWQRPTMVSEFRHRELEANYLSQLREWKRRDSPAQLWDSTWRRARSFWGFFVGPFLTPALLALLFSKPRRRLRPWLWVSAIFVAEHATYHAWYPQQSASETVLIVLLLVEGWRRLRVWRRGSSRCGLALTRTLTASFATAMVVLCFGLYAVNVARLPVRGAVKIWDTMLPAPSTRDDALRRLRQAPGKHLVFVHYGEHHPWYDEWVFNGADLQNSRILFVRMVSPEADRTLARTMPNREVWIAEPDGAQLLSRVNETELLLAWVRPIQP